MDFYDELAEHYDDMTRFADRMTPEMAMLQEWQARYGFTAALDVACGTGLHTIALTRLGIPTIGIDLSAAMLAQAQRHADELRLTIPWIQASMGDFARHLAEPSPALFCLGNSLPHVLNRAELEAVAQNFYDALAPGGIAAIQILNYQRILAEQQRIVGIHRQAERVYVRLYDFHPDQLTFHILTIHLQAGACPYTLQSTELKPYTQADLTPVFSAQGFTQFEYYGDMRFHPFEAAASGNLVMVAKKP